MLTRKRGSALQWYQSSDKLLQTVIVMYSSMHHYYLMGNRSNPNLNQLEVGQSDLYTEKMDRDAHSNSGIENVLGELARTQREMMNMLTQSH